MTASGCCENLSNTRTQALSWPTPLEMEWERRGLNNKKEKQIILTQTDVSSNLSLVSTGCVTLGKSLHPLSFYSLPAKWAQCCLPHRDVMQSTWDSRGEALDQKSQTSWNNLTCHYFCLDHTMAPTSHPALSLTNIFKHTEKFKDKYKEHLYTLHLDCYFSRFLNFLYNF